MQIDFEDEAFYDVGQNISWSDGKFVGHQHTAKVVMVIKGASGRRLIIFETIDAKYADKQSEAIKNFMEDERWLKLKESTQSFQQTAQIG